MSFSAAAKSADLKLKNGDTDWVNDDIRFLAVAPTYAFNPYHDKVEDVSAHEVTNDIGDGYERLSATNMAISQSSILSVSGITRSGTTATVTTSSAHNMAVGEKIYISGANEEDYNGWKTVTAVGSSTTFDCEVSGSPTTPATGTIIADEHLIMYDADNPSWDGIDTAEDILAGWWYKHVDGDEANDELVFFSRNIGGDGNPRSLPTNGSDVEMQVNHKGVHSSVNNPPQPDPA